MGQCGRHQAAFVLAADWNRQQPWTNMKSDKIMEMVLRWCWDGAFLHHVRFPRQRDWTISCLAVLLGWKPVGDGIHRPQGKQNFCCENHGIACQAAMTTPAFDCNEDYHKWFLCSSGVWEWLGMLFICGPMPTLGILQHMLPIVAAFSREQTR